MNAKRALCSGALALLSSALWAAAPPDLVNYQGVLRNAANQPLTGSFDMIFLFYDVEVGGTDILVDQHLASGSGAVGVQAGMFNVLLGSGTLVDGSGPGTFTSLTQVFQQFGNVYLQVEVGGETLTPRTRIASAPHALNTATPTRTRAISLEIYAMDRGSNNSSTQGNDHNGGAGTVYGFISGGGSTFQEQEFITLTSLTSAIFHLTIPPDYVSDGAIRFSTSAGSSNNPPGTASWDAQAVLTRAGNPLIPLIAASFTPATNADAGLPNNQIYTVTLPCTTALQPDDVLQIALRRGTVCCGDFSRVFGVEFVYTAAY